MSNHAMAIDLHPAQILRTLWFASTLAGCLVDDTWPGGEVSPVEPGTTAAGALGGSVVDLEGAPIAAARVTVDPSGVEAETDADGRWSVARLLPATYTVVAAAPGHAAARSAAVEVEAGGVSEVEVALPDAPVLDGLLRVTVVGPDGLPLAGAEVVATGAPSITGDDGLAVLDGLGGTTVTVTVSVADGSLFGRTVTDVAVPALGGAELALSLAGRADDEAHTVGSTVCRFCHVDIGVRWGATAHAQSTSAVDGLPAEAFDLGLVVSLGGASATFGRDLDGAPLLVLTDASGAEDTWTVAGFLGGEARGAIPWGERDGLGWPLPVAWVAPDPRYPGFVDGGWIAGDRGPWFGADDRFVYLDTPIPARSAESACFVCHVTGTTVALADGRVTMAGVSSPSVRWDEGAVGCEACHGRGETHSAGSLADKASNVTNPADLDPDRANDICGQCHAASLGEDGLPFPWTASHGLFRPGDTLSDLADSAFEGWPSGAAAVPGAMLDELRASAHGTGGWTAACADCHDPHGSDHTADLRQDDADNGLCAACHLELDFAGDEAAMADHTGHAVYQPANLPQSGRCVGCHMPATAARLGWSAATGAGDLSSHRFVAVPPSDSLVAFDAAGVDQLPPGAFAPNACQGCHAWNTVNFQGSFLGPTGDMTLRATHVGLQAAYEVLFP